MYEGQRQATGLLIVLSCAKLETGMPKRTFQPKKRHRSHVHGFMKRMATRAGRTVLHRRRLKGRTMLSR